MAVNNIQFTKIEVQIAKYLFKHYKDRYNARQLAKNLNINHAHVNKLCNLLAEKEIVKKEPIGNSNYFSYNYKNNLALKFIEYLISLEEKEFPKWLIVTLYNLKRFKPFIDLGLVFGSSIKTNKYNDVDVVLLYKKSNFNEIKNVKDTIRKMGQLEKPVRYLEITERDIYKNKFDKIFYNVISENLIFHNPEKYVEVIKNLSNR